MTKAIVTALALAGALMVLPVTAEAACTITTSKSNASYKVWEDETGKTCTPTAAEKATTVSGSRSNASSFKEGKPTACPTGQKMTPQGCK